MSMNLYIKDGQIIDPRRGVDKGDGTILYNGSPQEMAKLGYEVYVPKVYVEPLEIQIEKQIEDLRNSFTDDYKIIKCYEAQLMNRPMPYNIGELISERDSKRAQINNLENQLEQLRLNSEVSVENEN